MRTLSQHTHGITHNTPKTQHEIGHGASSPALYTTNRTPAGNSDLDNIILFKDGRRQHLHETDPATVQILRTSATLRERAAERPHKDHPELSEKSLDKLEMIFFQGFLKETMNKIVLNHVISYLHLNDLEIESFRSEFCIIFMIQNMKNQTESFYFLLIKISSI